MSSENPIIKTRNAQNNNSGKENTELISENSNKEGFMEKINNKVIIHPKKIAKPPILTIGILCVFLESGKSKNL